MDANQAKALSWGNQGRCHTVIIADSCHGQQAAKHTLIHTLTCAGTGNRSGIIIRWLMLKLVSVYPTTDCAAYVAAHER